MFRDKSQQELNVADEIMTRRYAQAAALARTYNMETPFVSRAFKRLAYLGELLGDAKMRLFVVGTTDPTDPAKTRKLAYTDGMFAQPPSNLVVFPTNSTASPLPAVP
jgi:hypothetical protein